MKIKKGYSTKILSTVVIAAFLLTNNVYPETLYKNSLRKPLDFNHKDKPIARYGEVLLHRDTELTTSMYNIDESSRIERRLLFLAEKLSLITSPLVLFSVITLFFSPLLNLDFYLCYLLLITAAIPQIVEFLIFQAIMILPVRIPLIRHDLYNEYYSKTHAERAEFILKRLKDEAEKNDDKEVSEVLSVVKGFEITKGWPVAGKVFDLPAGSLFVSAGMTKQPLQLQYMIMRRAREMWYLEQVKYREKPVYKYDIDLDTSRFLVLHSKYIGIFLIYEISLILSDISIARILKLFGHNPLLPASTIDYAMEVAKKRMREGEGYTPMEFAREFNFSEELTKKSLFKAGESNPMPSNEKAKIVVEHLNNGKIAELRTRL